MSRIALALFLVLALVPAARVDAADGVIEINQARANAGGVTSGDTAGWPVTLSQPGSYRLTGNLTVPANTTAIEITSRNVTLDLGGFEVAGPNVCTGVPVADCTQTFGNPGIFATASHIMVMVQNGRVYGMGGRCIHLEGDSSAVHRLAVFHCGNHGIHLGDHGRVTESSSISNRQHGIFFDDNGGSAEWNEVRGNGGTGIMKDSFNFDGIFIGNRAFNNATGGLRGNALATKNVVRVNGIAGMPGVSSLGDNLCDGVAC